MKVWLETLQHRTTRSTAEDPWAVRDNFRLNNSPLREVTLEDDQAVTKKMFVQYVDEDTYNVYWRNEEEFLVPCVLDAKVRMSTEFEDEVIVQDDHHTYIVDYFMNPKTEEVT